MLKGPFLVVNQKIKRVTRAVEYKVILPLSFPRGADKNRSALVRNLAMGYFSLYQH